VVLENAYQRAAHAFVYRTFTFYGVHFQTLQLTSRFKLPDLLQVGPQAPHNTADTTVAAFNISDGLDFFPFARRY
jgi:hypothetical protein